MATLVRIRLIAQRSRTTLLWDVFGVACLFFILLVALYLPWLV